MFANLNLNCFLQQNKIVIGFIFSFLRSSKCVPGLLCSTTVLNLLNFCFTAINTALHIIFIYSNK